MLPNYYKHICQYENSLVTKFYGVHCIKPVGGQKVCAVHQDYLLPLDNFLTFFFNLTRLGLLSWGTCSAQNIESRDGLTLKGLPMDAPPPNLKLKLMKQLLSRTLILTFLSVFREIGIKN